jgi:hypothetical protein
MDQKSTVREICRYRGGIKNECRINPAKFETRLDEALKIANDGLAEVRRSLIGMTLENIDCLKDALRSLVADYMEK